MKTIFDLVVSRIARDVLGVVLLLAGLLVEVFEGFSCGRDGWKEITDWLSGEITWVYVLCMFLSYNKAPNHCCIFNNHAEKYVRV